MKKILIALFVLVGITLGMSYAFSGPAHEPVVMHSSPPSVAPATPTTPEIAVTPAYIPPAGSDVSFKTVTSIGDSVATCNAWYTEFQNWYIASGDSFRLVLTKLKNGGTYRILIKKTVSGVVRVHYTGTGYYIIGGGTSFTLSGSTNSYFWLTITSNSTTNFILKE